MTTPPPIPAAVIPYATAQVVELDSHALRRIHAGLWFLVAYMAMPFARFLVPAQSNFHGSAVFGIVFSTFLFGAAQLPLKGLYFLLPHLDLFDLSQRTAYNYPPVSAWVLGVLAVYAAVYVFAFLGLGALRFRRMAV